MYETILARGDLIGACVVKMPEGYDLLMYSSTDGKHFFKSKDHFRTIDEEWVVPIGGRTANANLLCLRDGRLMTIVRKKGAREEVISIGGASYYTAFSSDGGHTFSELQPINPDDSCYYLMNDRLMRTHTGRILLPVCYVPDAFLSKEYQEKAGQAGCFFSDDDGESWQRGEFLPGDSVDQLAEPMVMEGENGILHLYARTGYGYLYRSRSIDDGVTWEPEVPSMLRSPCAPFCVKYDPYSRRYYAVWDNSFPGLPHQYPRCPICLADSENGKDWRLICELGNNPMHSYGYPMVCFYENEILIAYYENETRRFHAETHQLMLKLIDRNEIV
jgi:hypothetical protein